jgi:hypothetical protein
MTPRNTSTMRSAGVLASKPRIHEVEVCTLIDHVIVGAWGGAL